jgi:N-acyl-L-homoserine lactone synthetase
MLRYIYANDLRNFPKLRDSMFRDRAAQFAHRLQWEAVSVDANGHEIDQYDALNPLYVIWELEDGTHGASVRILPTTGRTMLGEHFSHVTDNTRIASPLIWECTRLCISPKADRRAISALVLAGAELIDEFGIEHLVGVFFSHMQRLFRLNRTEIDVLGSDGEGREKIDVAVWGIGPLAVQTALNRLGISRAQSKAWFHDSFSANRFDEHLDMAA